MRWEVLAYLWPIALALQVIGAIYQMCYASLYIEPEVQIHVQVAVQF